MSEDFLDHWINIELTAQAFAKVLALIGAIQVHERNDYYEPED